ncbi:MULTISPECIES: polyribonucleotide nucleotidyltransferase [unclassified Sulfurospirillum]|uniref:polyribonucleotide nucleotidyltransferase n=1 Tax=unclassified Sulfurospirillum TaxID=2618290 RepID=UPI0005423D36|nr:polyribonucleotide nucleotidyltransferase [Sulfurospirillum sp. MES]KHG35150.1 MAG: polynucleotide phosphorylase [Sulfurospirillum sp. MES]MCP3651878.1 polyribonucleotide nucleotidyltransferase [Sulfurospirillum sp. DNRA8]MCR1810725.1 polyribonucleotide nucleotidyltransferase [Sulfurospirillum sp. DNRA8]
MEYTFKVNNQEETYDIGKVAKQAAGAALLRIKNTVILATVARDDTQVAENFVPLTVQYVEKTYAVGKIPGGYVKRETKPGDFETLTSRIIDRSLRPLFPKGYAYPTQIVIFVLSCDPEVDLQVAALNAASAALYLSDIPVNKAVAGVRIGYIDGQYVVNPSNSALKNSRLDLYVAGTKEELLMIEMRAIASMETTTLPVMAIDPMLDPTLAQSVIAKQSVNEFDEEAILAAIDKAQSAITEATTIYENVFTPLKKEDALLDYKADLESDSIFAYIDEFYKEEVSHAILQMAKSERASELGKIVDKILKDDTAALENWSKELVESVLGAYKKRVVREMIVEKRVRADGRKLNEIRPISIETNLLPLAHGSCLFTRGQTQALVIATLGNDKDAQMYDLLTEKNSVSDTFMVNYNFPGFSVGEASPLRAPGRRELGHGNLARRALEPVVSMNRLQTIRLVSEILESNGSSSMATVCGGALALKAAGVEIEKLVAGIAMGLVFEGDKHAVLSDIMGLEDHDGDMDFKVAGTRDGITALQMDIKLGGISRDVLKEALFQAKEGRAHILGLMEAASREIVVNNAILPKLELFSVDPSKIVDIIGQAGKTIKEIIEKFEVSIDLDREKGEVKIAGENKTNVDAAKEHIIKITNKPSFGGRGGGHGRDRNDRHGAPREEKPVPTFVQDEIVDGTVKRIVDFGAFVELPGGIDGLLHVSKIADHRVEKVSDYLALEQKVRVKILKQTGNKIELELIR